MKALSTTGSFTTSMRQAADRWFQVGAGEFIMLGLMFEYNGVNGWDLDFQGIPTLEESATSSIYGRDSLPIIACNLQFDA